MLTPPEGLGPQGSSMPLLLHSIVFSWFVCSYQFIIYLLCSTMHASFDGGVLMVSRVCFPFFQEGLWFIHIHPVPVIGYLWCQCSKRLHGCILQVLQHSTASKTCKTRAFIGGTWWNCKILQVWGLRFLATCTHKDFIKVLWWCESQSSGIRVVSNDHPWSPSGQGCTDDGRCRLEGLVLLRDLTIDCKRMSFQSKLAGSVHV